MVLIELAEGRYFIIAAGNGDIYMWKKAVSLLCCLTVLAGGISAAADGMPVEQADIVTEYYYDELLTEPVFEEVDQNNPGAPAVNAKGAVLMEASTGEILFSSNPDARLYPASITKIMTMLLIVEAIDNGKITSKDVVTVSEHAASMGGSQIWLEPQETMTVDQLMKAMCIGSANDASVALAEHLAGSEESFVSMMNARAKELGMKNTNFVNACGLDVEGQYTSALDVAIMSAQLIQHDTIKKYTTIWMDSLRNGQTQLVNTNKLVRYYKDCNGLKTGTTSQAGFCVSATAKRNEMQLVAVVMGAANNDDRFGGAKKMLDYGFANWEIGKITIDESQIQPVKVKLGSMDQVEVGYTPTQNMLLRKGESKNMQQEMTLLPEVSAPVKEGQVLGKISITLNGEEVDQINLIAEYEVPKLGFGGALMKIMQVFFRL